MRFEWPKLWPLLLWIMPDWLALSSAAAAGEPYDIVSAALLISSGGVAPIDLAEVTTGRQPTAPVRPSTPLLQSLCRFRLDVRKTRKGLESSQRFRMPA